MSTLPQETSGLTNNGSEQLFNNSGGTKTETCGSKVDHNAYYLYLLIPATFLTIILSFTQKRQSYKTNIFHGRPGLVYPMNFLGRSKRFIYGSAFGAITHLCLRLLLNGTYVVNYKGPYALGVFPLIFSVLVYGIDYYPLFTALAVDSLIGYIIGSLYSLMLLLVFCIENLTCAQSWSVEGILLVLPILLCLVFTAVGFPIRMVLFIRKKLKPSETNYDDKYFLEKICKSYQGLHVRKILEKKDQSKLIEENVSMRDKMTRFIKTWLYSSIPNFRYSTRVISVLIMGLIILYVCCWIFYLFWRLVKYKYSVVTFLCSPISYSLRLVRHFVGLFPGIFKSTSGLLILGINYIFPYVLLWCAVLGVQTNNTGYEDICIRTVNVMQDCLIVSVIFPFIIGVLNIVHFLTSYRTDLLSLYKGQHEIIPKPEDKQMGNSFLLSASIRYGGYQVAYIGWAFFIQTITCFILTSILALLIHVAILREWFVERLLELIPTIVTLVIMIILQLVLSRYVFLQNEARSLAIDNRRGYFVFMYFMFFYNMFLGIMSCLLRILKALAIGLFFLSRLDRSNLPERFQFLDPGFKSYIGFMCVESTHTNPVMITFVKLLRNSRRRTYTSRDQNRTTTLKYLVQNVFDYDQMCDVEIGNSQGKISKRAIRRWHLFYTLIKNPEMRTLRRTYPSKHMVENQSV